MESRIELGGSRTFSIENVLVPSTPILLLRAGSRPPPPPPRKCFFFLFILPSLTSFPALLRLEKCL